MASATTSPQSNQQSQLPSPPSLRRPLNLDWGNWLYGMWLAIASGLSTAGLISCGEYLQKPNEHNATQKEFWVSFGMILAITSGKDFFLYLSQNPAPKIITRESTTSVTQQTSPSGNITTTAVSAERTTEKPATEEKAKS